MTTDPGSMRFQLHEVFAGMLATVERDTFSDDPAGLAAMFEQLGQQYPLFAPFPAGVDPEAVGEALPTLESGSYIEHTGDEYVLTEEGRAHCSSSKRTLFNQADREQLEATARIFDTR